MRVPLLAALLLLCSRVVSACQCGEVPPPLEALSRSVAVFDGTAVSRTPVLRRLLGETVIVEEYAFAVHQSWLGVTRDHFTLVQGFSNCDSHFVIGSRYLVFAVQERYAATPTSGICLPTQAYANASAALKDLGAGLALSSPTSTAPETPGHAIARKIHVSFLAGVALTSQVFTFPRWIIENVWPAFLLGSLALLIAVATLSACLLRRRVRLAGALAMPLVLFAAICITIEGYVVLRAFPLWWHLIDFVPPGA